MSPGPDDGRRDGTRLQVGAVIAAGIAIVALGVLGRLDGTGPVPSQSPGAVTTPAPAPATEPPDPAALFHAWQRPYAVTPDQTQYPSGRLTLREGRLDLRTDVDGLATTSELLAVDPARLLIGPEALADGDGSATPCPSGEDALYAWSITAAGTWLELAPILPDPCPGRQARLAGPWVRESRIVQGDLPAGIYVSQFFAPFGPGLEGQVSIDLPAGWQLIDDQAAALAFYATDGGDPLQRFTFIQLLAQPHVMAVPDPGAGCDTAFGDAAGVGTGVDDIVLALTNRPGVIATEPAPLAIDGHAARRIDLEVVSGWTGGCETPEGHVVLIPLLQVTDAGGLGPGISLGPDVPVRLILVDLGSGRTLTIALTNQGPGVAGSLPDRVADLMPIAASIQLHPPAP